MFRCFTGITVQPSFRIRGFETAFCFSAEGRNLFLRAYKNFRYIALDAPYKVLESSYAFETSTPAFNGVSITS